MANLRRVDRKKPANLGEAIKIKQDWGVQNIDGWTESPTGKNQGSDFGLRGELKDDFLNDAKRYLKAVSKRLEDEGFSSHVDNKGKGIAAVYANESGPATSGDVSLSMRRQVIMAFMPLLASHVFAARERITRKVWQS